MKAQRKVVLVTVLGLLVVAVGACSPSDTSGDTTVVAQVETENPYGAGLVDPPQPGEPILQVDVHGDVTEFSLESLKKLPATTVELFEPFIMVRSSFTGVSLEDLFDAVGIKADDKVDTVALNEYRYTNTAKEFTASDGLLAYEQNGQPIPMDRGGPIRIVFPDTTPLSSVLDAWNWAISSIIVK
ncbi:MAG: molybdopterin-dependent oxidoreductase [Ilumatobacteraceae bacterium]